MAEGKVVAMTELVSSTTVCQWLHTSLSKLPIVSMPFELLSLPKNGIYFLYEKSECSVHSPKESLE